jgi:hypothetical protein
MRRSPVSPLSGLTVALGLLTVAWPVPWTRTWGYAAAGLGVVAVLAAAILRWRGGPGLAVAAAIVSCALSGAGVAVLAAEGLFILGYLLAVDAPAGLAGPGRWLRRQAVLLVPGLIGTGAVLAAYAVRPSASAWLALAGIAAAVAAYLVALSSLRRDKLPPPSLLSSTRHLPARWAEAVERLQAPG